MNALKDIWHLLCILPFLISLCLAAVLCGLVIIVTMAALVVVLGVLVPVVLASLGLASFTGAIERWG